MEIEAKEHKNKENRRAAYYLVAKNAAAVISVFLAAVLVIMAVSFFQSARVEPVPSPRLEELIGRVHSGESDENLKEVLLEYDLMARRAYFSNIAFRRFGSYLLLVGAAMLLAVLKIMSDLKPKEPEPGKFVSVDREIEKTSAVQYAMLGGIAALIAGALAFSRFFPLIPETPQEILAPVSREEMMQNWPSFRGYGGRAVAYPDEYPVKWDGESGLGIKWKTPLPLPGVNSPVVWEGKVFASGANENVREVYCLDARTGEILWTAQTSGGSNVRIPDIDIDTGLAAPTLATDGRYLGAVFATGELLILNLEGDITSEIQLGVPDNIYGHSSSLLARDGLLFVQYDQYGESELMAFEMPSGRLRWSTPRNVETSWSSPVLIDNGAGLHLVLVADDLIAGYDPETGEVLWEIEGVVRGEIGPSGAFDGERLYVANQFSVLVAIDISSEEILWKYRDDLPEASSPAADKGLLILPSSYEMLSCLDGETGELLWSRRFETDFYSSPVISGESVYFIDREGVAYIFALDRDFRKIAKSPLGERVDATPAFAAGNIFIRGKENLYCIGGGNE